MAAWLRLLTLGATALLAFGLAWLFAYTLAEAFFGDGAGSLVDGYWRGRLPWMGIAEALIVVGATACAGVGAVAVMVEGGWIRRLAVIPAALVVAMWWFLAALVPARQAVPCTDCPPPNVDPWAYAYSVPQTTLLFLIVPAVILVLLALVRPRPAEIAAIGG
ncbi:MAG TPA: hypothetical protein VF114_04910 [Candidatus Limnocylindria bacterium]